MTGRSENAGVSVIVAAYRAHGTIVRAVRSLLAQGWTAWQAVIVSDDGTDYRATLRAAGIDDSRLLFTDTGAVGAGAPAARNAGLACATRPLVAPLDADDLYRPGRLEALAPLALAHGAAFDNIAVVRDEDGTALSTLFTDAEGVDEIDADGFLETSVPMFPVVRRELARWEESVDFCDDLVFNMRLFGRIGGRIGGRAGGLPLVRAPLYEYRQRAGSITFSADSGDRAERGYRHVLDRLAGDGLGIADAGLRARFAAAVERKRTLNAAYDAARKAGLCANFQEFLVLRGA